MSALDSFETRLADLDDALPRAPQDLQAVLLEIRTATLRVKESLDELRRQPILPQRESRRTCFDCGAKNLEVFFTSPRDHYHLCPSCFEAREQRGLARLTSVPAKEI